jgi:ribonucleoside-diphosphate reductase alpha chain
MANRVGPFAGFHKDREGMIKVLKQHREAVSGIDAGLVDEALLDAAAEAWDEAVELAEKYGVRNSQASVLAPTGTIGLMMDCDTTGIEPDLGLVKFKKLVGGGNMTIVNQTVPRALKVLGYTQSQVDEIVGYIDVEKTIIGAPHLKKEHQAVFSCSMGDNSIHYMGHVKMMSAVQPFISGAISKTVNMPEEATVEEIEQLHMESWKLGLKAVAIYRDNCKVAQPLSMAKKGGNAQNEVEQDSRETVEDITDKFVLKGAVRRKLPKVRTSKTFSFQVADSKGFFTVGEFDDGTPGELFISTSKHGSTLRGLIDAFAISISYGLQYGVPLKAYIRNFSHMSFAPSGITDDPEIRTASSMVDYIFRKLGKTYLSFDDQLELGLASIDDMPEAQTSLLDEPLREETKAPEIAVATNVTQPTAKVEAPAPRPVEPNRSAQKNDDAAPMCFNCGNQTQKAGSCYVCTSCGSTTGCS